MQDRHLFRGKRSDNLKKDWVMGHYVSVPRPMIVLDRLQLNGSWNCFDIDPATVGQCTGLHAAKSYRGESEADRLIFEHDTVRNSDGKVGYIKWCDGMASFSVAVMENGLEYYHDFLEKGFNDWAVEKLEITGTTHDRTEG